MSEVPIPASLFAFIGTQDMIVVLVIALIVFGPQKLPEIGRQIGSAMRELRKMSGDVQRAFDLEDFGNNSASAYDSLHWNEAVHDSHRISAEGNTPFSAATAGLLEGSETSYTVASEGMGGFVAPPGPAAAPSTISDENKENDYVH